jgi:hypothetical protein
VKGLELLVVSAILVIVIVLLLYFTAIFRPSYSDLPDHYRILGGKSAKSRRLLVEETLTTRKYSLVLPFMIMMAFCWEENGVMQQRDWYSCLVRRTYTSVYMRMILMNLLPPPFLDLAFDSNMSILPRHVDLGCNTNTWSLRR